ncbi:MAG: hypothetical protein K5821_13420 [Nitrobacter sp.]|uniref:PC4/YdbC family ssDNA-binding protein n=1 Tax=Nitrobacter sp. TaxID=29420 RepID=UPI0026299110|nr:PC4/YdbC family ssDNA-binding protein [Nitrobacter sp.]MCV0387403.1 hypothetical protein [Nitrobacter sp.]
MRNEEARRQGNGGGASEGDHQDRAEASFNPSTKQRTGRKPTLEEPVEIAKFWKNRKGDAVIVALTSYQGYNLVDLRTHFTNKEGKLQPTPKGLSVAVLRLPDLAKAVNAALKKAAELGLIREDAE